MTSPYWREYGIYDPPPYHRGSGIYDPPSNPTNSHSPVDPLLVIILVTKCPLDLSWAGNLSGLEVEKLAKYLVYLRILATLEAKTATISNFWTFWPVITVQNVQKLLILAVLASSVASILNVSNFPNPDPQIVSEVGTASTSLSFFLEGFSHELIAFLNLSEFINKNFFHYFFS